MARTKTLSRSLAAEGRRPKDRTVPSSSPETRPSQRFWSWRRLVRAVLFLSLAGLLVAAGYLFSQYRQRETKDDPSKELRRLTDHLSQFMDLPADEEPTFATVTDKSKLEGQPFFKNAHNGDEVLIYVKSGKAILYRPETRKVIDVSTVNVAGQGAAEKDSAPSSGSAAGPQGTVSPPSPQATPFSVALYNGTKTVGLTSGAEDLIRSTFPEATVAKKDAASRTDYRKSLVVDVSGRNSAEAKRVAQAIGAETAPLPDGEARPEADLLVIVGTDRD
jgi:hypothetical protein